MGKSAKSISRMGALTALMGLLVFAADAGTSPSSGTLRVLVRPGAEDFLLPQANTASRELDLLQAFAKAERLALQVVPVDRFEALIPALLAGRGDVIAAGLSVTGSRKAQVAFSRPSFAVDEVVVGRAGAARLPRALEALAGEAVHVSAGTSFVEALEAARGRAPGLMVEVVPGPLPPDQLARDVAEGTRPLTVIDSLRLQALRVVYPQLEPLFVLTPDRPVAFALRKQDRALRSRLDAFLIARAFSAPPPVTGDLDAILKRGALRLITRNNAVSFYLRAGDHDGFEYNLVRSFAQSLGVRLEVVLAPSYDQLLPMLQRGEGDLVAASLTVTPERAQVVAFSSPYLTVREQVVQRASEPPLSSLEALRGRTLHVRPSSSYAATLARLQPQYGFTVAPASEDTEVEDLLADVAEGVVPLTVADSHFLKAEQLVRKNLLAGPELTEDRALAFAVRKENPKLLAAVDRWLGRSAKGLEFNMLKRRAFDNPAQARVAHFGDVAATGRLSRWDPLIKRMGERYRFDWRFLAAQAFRESRFDASARSFAGALGLFQVMPATGRELGFLNLLDAEQGAQAGVSYLAGLLKRIEPEVGLDDRLRFALAAYNAGFTRLEDARRIARTQGWDPNAWKDNVEKAYGLLSRPQYARASRAGFCRCQEPIDYVNAIEGNYRTWLQLLPER